MKVQKAKPDRPGTKHTDLKKFASGNQIDMNPKKTNEVNMRKLNTKQIKQTQEYQFLFDFQEF